MKFYRIRHATDGWRVEGPFDALPDTIGASESYFRANTTENALREASEVLGQTYEQVCRDYGFAPVTT